MMLDFATLLPGILTTWATIGRPPRGDHEYVLWQIGHAHPTVLH